jgi:hypothetical protein
MEKLVDFAHGHQWSEPYLAEAELASLQNQLLSLQAKRQALHEAATKAQKHAASGGDTIDLGY